MSAEITCPRCGAISHHPKDIEQRYCGRCHVFWGDRADFLAVMICPDHRAVLEECEDRDEFGVAVWYRCTAVEHFFGSVYDHESGLYWPVEEAAS